MPVRNNKNAQLSIIAFIFSISILFLKPVYATILMSHILMILCILYWTFKSYPNYIVSSILYSIVFLLYILLIDVTHGLGDRFFVESSKMMMLLLFTLFAIRNYNFAKEAATFISVSLIVSLTLYIIFSPNPLVYGDRIGVIIDESKPDSLLSANTIGLAANFAFATILARKNKYLYFLVPAILVILYLTFSRGALLSFFAICMIFFMKNTKYTMFAVVSGIFAIAVFFDFNSQFVRELRLDDATGSGRTIIYDIMLQNMANSPLSYITGFGPGSINVEIYANKILVSAHSGYFEMLYTFGILGISLFGYLLLLVFIKFRFVFDYSLFYAILFATYSISEDLFGAHSLMPFGFMLGIMLQDLSMIMMRRAAVAPAKNGAWPARNGLVERAAAQVRSTRSP